MKNLDNDIYEFNKIDAYNKLEKEKKYIYGDTVDQNFDKFIISQQGKTININSA